MAPLGYVELFQICEELQKLRGAQLQAAHNPSQHTYVLEFRQPGENRFLLFDLTPSRPLVLSTSSTKLKTHQTKKTPVLNFLRAHFVNHRLETLEIAQKPNRTIRLVFTQGPELFFKCFPHGHHLLLKAEGKIVNFPLRPKDETEEEVTFIEPELSQSWEYNEDLAEPLTPSQAQVSKSDTYQSRLLKKLERALKTLDEGTLLQREKDQGRIEVLENEARRAKGEDLDQIYSEIKRLKKKTDVAQVRRQDILAQIEKLKNEPITQEPQKAAKKKDDRSFSGTRVRLSESWELWVGRDAWQNDDLLRLGSASDLWLHLRDYPGAHGLIRGPKKSEPTQSQIELACQIVASLSQSKKRPFSEGQKLDVILTPKKFVKKRKGDAPGRVIVERENVRRIAFRSVKFQVI